jgi:hypothetical protein
MTSTLWQTKFRGNLKIIVADFSALETTVYAVALVQFQPKNQVFQAIQILRTGVSEIR